MQANLRQLDLNLLRVFDALLRHRSVVQAAQELAMSPSALSHALARLRQALDDALFVRNESGMQPTPLAERLARPVSAALTMLGEAIAQPQGFEPGSSRRQFRLAVTDYTAFTVLPRLMAHLQQVAPGVRVQVTHSQGRESALELAAGSIDLALGYEEDVSALPNGIERMEWLRDRYVVIARQGQASLADGLNMECYLAAKHVVVTPWGSATRGQIDKTLSRLGVQRDIAIELPSVLVAPFIVGQSDLLMTVPQQAALALQATCTLTIYPLPFALTPYTINLYQHSRSGHSEANQWLCAQLQTLAPGMLV